MADSFLCLVPWKRVGIVRSPIIPDGVPFEVIGEYLTSNKQFLRDYAWAKK